MSVVGASTHFAIVHLITQLKSFCILDKAIFCYLTATRDNVFNLQCFAKIAWCAGNWGLQSPSNYLKRQRNWPTITILVRLLSLITVTVCACVCVCTWVFMPMHTVHSLCMFSWLALFSYNDDLILLPISYLVADIPRIDSFGHKARQKDEVQNCVLLTSAAYALQEDVQGWDSLLQCHELRGRW